MSRASTPTLLSLDRFARLLGINPVHFNGASGDAIWIRKGACDETWVQHPWQSGDTISREELASAIAASENEIARYLGWNVAPAWSISETHRWPQSYSHANSTLHYSSRGLQPAVQLNRGEVIAGGRRAVELIGSDADVTYSDEDGDAWDEIATISIATALTDASDIQVFFAGHSGHPSWEIRPILSAVISGGLLTIKANSWLFIDPDLWEAFPTQYEQPDIKINDDTNLVDIADVYRVYNDTTQVASQLRWRSSCVVCGGSGCPACNPSTQDGCLSVVDSPRGLVLPIPASYESSAWVAQTWSSSYSPDTISFWYYSGEISQDYQAGYTRERLSDYWAETISWLTAARLNRPVCSCAHVQSQVAVMQTDMLLNRRETGSRFIPAQSYVHDNPLGFRYGEVRAWLRINEAMTWKGGSA